MTLVTLILGFPLRLSPSQRPWTFHLPALSLGSQSLLGEPGLLRGGSTRVVAQALPRAPHSGASAFSPGEDEFVRQSPTFPDFFTFCDFLRDGPTFSIRHLQNRTRYLHTRIFYEKSESLYKTRATISFLGAWSTFVGKKPPEKTQCRKMKTTNARYTKSDYPNRFSLQNCYRKVVSVSLKLSYSPRFSRFKIHPKKKKL